MYYISGWTIHDASKISKRRNTNTRQVLTYFVNTVCIDGSCADQKRNLPTGKVDRHICYGGLRYSTYPYFIFILNMEKVHSNILTEEYIVALGSSIVDKIRVGLKDANAVLELFSGFLPPDILHTYLDYVLHFVLSIYERMRGEGFCYEATQEK